MADEAEIKVGHDRTPDDPNQTSTCTLDVPFISIEYYARGRPAPAKPSLLLAQCLTEKARDSVPAWKFSPEDHPKSYRAHRDIYVARVRCELTLNNEDNTVNNDEGFNNVRAILCKQVPEFFAKRGSQPLLVLFSKRGSQTALKDKDPGAKLLSGFSTTPKQREIATGESSLSEAVLEVAFLVGGISLIGYTIHKWWPILTDLILPTLSESPSTKHGTADGPKQAPSASASPSPPTLPKQAGHSAAMKQTVQEVKDSVGEISSWLAFLRKLSPTLRNQERLRTIADGRRKLRQDCEQLEADLERVNSKVQAIFSSAVEQGSQSVDLSREDILHIMQLLVSLSESHCVEQENLDQLVPLLDQEYSKEKRLCHTGAAVCGAAVALYVVLPWLSVPVMAYTWGWSWLLSHSATSAVIAGAGASVSAACGSLAWRSHTQITKRENVRTDHIRVMGARKLLFAWLVANLIDKEELEQLDAGDKSEICEKLGIQVELLKERYYPPAGLKTTWDEHFDAMSKYRKSCKDLADAIE